MRNLIISTLLVLALLLPAAAAANPVTRQQAQHNALTFLESKGKSINSSTLRHAPSRSSSTITESYYVFNIGEGEGYVIAAGDDCAPAILGYADSGYIDVDSLPENMKSWLEEYARQVQFMQEQGYPSSSQTVLSSNRPAISPLLTSLWGQDYPYNMNCPDFFGMDNSVSGCVATAMAQVMYYHRRNSVSQTTATIPAYTCKRSWTFGNESYQISVDSIPAGAVIDWNAMLDEYYGYEPSRQREAVANLMKYCGASVKMDYANAYNGGSSAYSRDVAVALKSYFDYNVGTSIQDRRYFSSDDEWNDLIYAELQNSRPVYYSGSSSSSGHAFVCDGFDGAGYYHINWGWNGSFDGYFLLTALNPTGSSSSGYNQYQEALIYAFPKLNSPSPSAIINFADDNVKAICVQNWDFDGDGQFSKAEAAAVTTINNVFRNHREITSFNELQYFTGLSRIGNSAFIGCRELKSITLPGTVTAIGDDAFDGCSNLISVVIPNTVTSIGDYAFEGCIALTSVPISSSVTTIGNYAFSGCIGLTSVTIPASVTSIGSGAFSGCNNLTRLVVSSRNTKYDSRKDCNAIIETASNTLIVGCASSFIPNTVTSIGVRAFAHCDSLTSITIPNSVISIGEWAFVACYNLSSLTIGSSVTTIGEYAFSGCFGLTSVTIPNSVTTIGDWAFYRCRDLTSLTIGNSLTTIGRYVFADCMSLASLTFGTSVTTIGDYAFYNCSSLARLTIPNSVTTLGEYAFYGCSGLTSVTIPNSVTTIGNGVFMGCSGLTSVTIPNSVTTIGNGAFYGCSGLTSLTIPTSVTAIGNSSFSNCSGLMSLTIPNSVTTIGNNAFYNCCGLTSVTLGNSIISVGDGSFYGCDGLTSLTIPNSVKFIGERAFAYCSGLKRVTVGTSVNSIGNGVFAYCNRLMNIVVNSGNPKYDSRNNCNAVIEKSSNALVIGCMNTIIPSSVTSIGDHAFYGCRSLTNLTIPIVVTSIGEYAFFDCSNLTNVTFSTSLISIGVRAFSGCSGLTSVTLPNSVTDIGDYAFNSCTGLEWVTIPSSVTTIGRYVFAYCSGLKNVTIPTSVTSIGESAFMYCSALTRVTIPSSVTELGYAAFAICQSLMDVYSYITDPSRVNFGRYVFYKQYEDYTGCTLHVPHGRADAYQADENWSQYFEHIVDYMMQGDVNGDGTVNIADINAVINIILRSGGYATAADVNNDGAVNIADINALIDTILL